MKIKKYKLNFFFILCFVFSLNFIFQFKLSAQTSPLPSNLQKITLNSRALEDVSKFTVSATSSSNTQNLLLANVGVVLLINTTTPLNDSVDIRLIDDEGNDVEEFKINDSSFFYLISKTKTYSLIQDFFPSCSNEDNIICPDLISYKIKSNIKTSLDSRLTITPRKLKENYKIEVTLPENSKQEKEEDINLLEVSSSTSKLSSPINAANLLSSSNLCIVGRTKIVGELLTPVTSCTFSSPQITSIIKFSDGLKKVSSTTTKITLSIPFLKNKLTKLKNDILLNVLKNTTEDKIEISSSSNNSNFTSYEYDYNFNIGSLTSISTDLGEGNFSLPGFTINKVLNKITFNTSITEDDIVISPIKINSPMYLLDLTLNGTNTDINETISIKGINNIVLPNLSDDSRTIKNQSSEESPTTISFNTYIPEGGFDFNFSRNYSLVEQNFQTSVDSNGNSTTVVNDKAQLNFVISKDFLNTPVGTNDISLITRNPIQLLNDEFTILYPVTGFLIPPDQRPVVEDGYRATISFSMDIPLSGRENLNINYQELETKDEVVFTNFFKFSFLPSGSYDCIIKYNANRKDFFKKLGVVLP